MVEPHDAAALPVGIGTPWELQKLGRMTFRIAKLEGRHAAR